jgi:hypothetical protein
LDPGKPFDFDTLQKFFLLSFTILGKDKDAMPPFLKPSDEIDDKRSLNSVIRTRWKGRSNDTDVHS